MNLSPIEDMSVNHACMRPMLICSRHFFVREWHLSFIHIAELNLPGKDRWTIQRGLSVTSLFKQKQARKKPESDS